MQEDGSPSKSKGLETRIILIYFRSRFFNTILVFKSQIINTINVDMMLI